MAMKVEALVVDDTRGHFRRGQVERLPPKEHEVLINIEYAGVCHSDYHSVKGEWAGPNYYPMTPGHEIAGVVEKVGSSVTKYKVGDRVGVGCFIDSCRSCDQCHAGDEQYCEKGMVGTYNSKLDDGRVTYGGYSQKITVDENYVLSIPESIELKDAAPLLCAGITLYSPLVYYGAKEGGKGFKTAIVGLGGLGDMGVKIAKKMGNDVTVISTSERKRDYAKSLGAEFVVSTNDEDMKKHQHEFDLIISTVSAEYDPSIYFNLVKTNGKFVVVGAPPEPLPVPAMMIFARRLQMGGSLIGGIKETQEMLEFCAKHQIWPEAEHIKAEEINRAYVELGNNKANKQRFVIDVKDTMSADGDWKVSTKELKNDKKHTVNKNKEIHGAEDTTGKTYYPEKDVFE